MHTSTRFHLALSATLLAGCPAFVEDEYVRVADEIGDGGTTGGGSDAPGDAADEDGSDEAGD